MTVQPLLAEQEGEQAVRYWEGAVSVRGRSGSDEVTGSGYAELAGYEQTMESVKP